MTAQKSGKTRIIEEGDPGVVVRPKPRGSVPASAGSVDEVALPGEAAVLPVRNVVIFPGTVMPLSVGREKSRRLLNDVLPDQKIIVTVCQRDPGMEDPTGEDLFQCGTAAMVLKLLRLEDGNQSVIVHGLTRVRIEEWTAVQPYLRAKISEMTDFVTDETVREALMVNARDAARRVIELSPKIPDEAMVVLDGIGEPGAMSDFLASNIQMDVREKQMLLEDSNVNHRLTVLGAELTRQLDVLELSHKIQNQVRANIDKSQRQYFLQEQLKAIQKELGQGDERSVEVEDLREKIESIGMPETAGREARRELDRLAKIPTVSPEYNVIRTYLDWMTELPWSESTEDRLDVDLARKVLDEDHYDLEKVKRRILEYLAVRKLAPQSRGPILCFVGPPGVGKTSLGKSIARALGRAFIRMSLGGMRDEAELRGHRKTYIGAMPGRIVQEIRKAGTNNPVFMLDELDKVGADFRGDPTSALLEVLDPAQNDSFQDHYLNVPFDLSKVMFIATANHMGPVPPALRDRMEVIGLPGYTLGEKVHIAMKYLLPRQLTENGLTNKHARWNEEAVQRIVEQYTREAGVRELERQIGTVCRGLAALVASGKARSRKITRRVIVEMLGPRKYESELALRTATPGVATGLAYTPSGGEIIFVEAAAYEGGGKLTLTGQIGDVMRESVQAAFSLLKSRAARLGIDMKKLAQRDIHVHVPAGAIPKDGPSAGVAMFTALTSLLTDQAVRWDVAMTGEVTLRGLVLPIGGVKEKLLAAKRAGIRAVILPSRNRKDLVDVPADVRDGLEIIFAKTVTDVLNAAIVKDAPPRRGKKKR